MHQACEIIAKLVDDNKINGQDAVILMHAVLNNNLKTSDWFVSPNSNWWQNGLYDTGKVDVSSLTGTLTVSDNSLISTKSSY
jgi:hypothetical protein